MAGRIAGRLLVAGALGFLLVPVVVVVLFGFHASGRLTLPFEGLSLRWYEAVADGPEYRAAIEHSVLIAVATAAVTALLGTLATFGLAAAPPRLRAALGLLFFAPVALPPLFLGLALLTVYVELGVSLSLLTVAVGHIVFAFPYFVLIARAALERLDPDYDMLAADLGAGPVQRFRTVTFPLVWPALLAATTLVFAISFDEFIITFFVIGPDSTVPMVLWSAMRRSIDPTINVLATLLLVVTAVGVLTAAVLALGRRGSRIEEPTT